MQHPDEGTIHAWLDGALPDEEASQIQSHVAACAECKAAVAEARGLIAASSRIVSSLDIVPGGVIPVRAPVKRWYASTQLRAAAAVLFVAGASFVLMRGRDGATLSDTASKVMSAPAAESAPAVPAPVVVPAPEAQDAAPAEREIARVARPGSVSANARPLALEDRSLKVQPQSRSDGEQRQNEPRAKTNSEMSGTAVTGIAAASAPAAPPPVAAQAAAPELPREAAKEASRDVANRSGFTRTLQVSPVVVTAEKPAAGERLKILGVDSIADNRITRYETSEGVILTLIEARILPSPTATAMRRAEQPIPKRDSGEMDQTLASIRWSNPEKGRTYILSGKLSREKLEEARKAIEAATR